MKIEFSNLEEIEKKYFKFGCIIPTFERQNYVTNTFLSISKSNIPDDTIFILIDDCSSSDLVIPDRFYRKCKYYIKIKKDKNLGVSNSLAIGFDILNILKCKYFLNLDSDAEVAKDWIYKLYDTYKLYNSLKCVVSGFDGFNHPVIQETSNYKVKDSIGGINLFFHKDIYKYVRKSLTTYKLARKIEDIVNKEEYYGKNPKLHEDLDNKLYNGWDWSLKVVAKKENIKFICTKKSVVQHIGKFGLTSSTEIEPDFFEVSTDFENSIKTLCFIFPDFGENCGGYLVQNDIYELLTYESEYNTLKIKNSEIETFINNTQKSKENYIIILFWGPIVDEQISKFKDWSIVYWAHSCGYEFKNLNCKIPIITVSRHTMSYYGTNFNNPLFLLYSPIEIEFEESDKDIDILLQKRKCSNYVLNDLIPKVRVKYNLNIVLIDNWLGDRKDFLNLLKRSKIYIYDSKEYWNSHNLTEGFGLPPIEAIMNECVVFSSLNSALSDILDPLINCYHLTGNIEYDIKNIDFAINNYDSLKSDFKFKNDLLSKKSFLRKFNLIMNHIEKNLIT